MNRADKRQQKKLARKAGKSKKPVRSALPKPSAYTSETASGSGQEDLQQTIARAVHWQQKGDYTQAANLCRRALVATPNQPVLLHLLGVISFQLGNPEDAIEAIKKAVELKPDYADAHSDLGTVYKSMGDLAIASECYQKALALSPNSAEAHNNLGNVRKDQGKLSAAVDSFSKALAIKPQMAEVHYNLGNALKELGQADEALKSYANALAIKPGYADAHNNIGTIHQAQGRTDEAMASYQKTLAIKSDYAEAHKNLGSLYYRQGHINQARQELEIAISLKPEIDGWRIRQALTLPVIPNSIEDLRSRRSQLAEQVETLQNLAPGPLSVKDPYTEIYMTSFYLAYHAISNKSLQQDIANLHLSACPKLSFEAPHCRTKRPSEKHPEKKRLRIGFLSTNFQNHTIGKLSRGLIKNVSRDLFEVVVFQFPGKNDAIAKAIESAADRVVLLQQDLDADWSRIAGEELDILFYLDIGMDPYTYFLAFARLAPVQAVTWGHPDTTGIPNIDYFVSSRLLEGPDAAQHYSEKLHNLSLLPACYARPSQPENFVTRAELDLPAEGTLYVCPQTLFKFHPDFDATLHDLLAADPQSYLVLIDAGDGSHWNKLLLDRLGDAFPDIKDRVLFVDRMSSDTFLALLVLADVVLDTPHFSGGNSSLEAFAMSVPIVTTSSEFMRGRVTAGYYKQMGLSDLIAPDRKSYVTLALKLAHDPGFKTQMQKDISENSHKLFDRIEVVRELEEFFVGACLAAQSN